MNLCEWVNETCGKKMLLLLKLRTKAVYQWQSI